MEEIKYYLVLEKRHGDYNIIDINKLDICDFIVSNNISSIDSFTSLYTVDELKMSISRSNMISNSDYLEGNLRIISDANHNLETITKNVVDEVKEFQNDNNELTSEFKNKIFGYYKKIVENTFEDKIFVDKMLKDFKEVKNTGNKKDVFKKIEFLPYERSREIYLKLFQELMQNKNDKLRKLKKLNDVA